MAFATGNSLAPHIVKSAAILGPNGSGKSSILSAMSFYRSFVVTSHQQMSVGDPIRFSRNKLVSRLKEEPSEFEATFIHGDELFQYGFRLDRHRVHEEWLFARHSKLGSRIRLIFHRALIDAKSDLYEWDISDSQLSGRRETWKEATRPNALFMSVAVQLNSEYLAKPYSWLRDNLHIVPSMERIDEDFTAQLLEDEKSRAKIIQLLSSLDLKISGFRVEKKKRELPENISEVLSSTMIEKIQQDIEGEVDYRVFAQHKADDGEIVEINLKSESDGTQALFGMSGPIFDVLENGYTLVVDELSNSLHPMALKALVKIFHDTSLNSKGAQLIFTSHETAIISNDLMHRDQIWFVNRDNGVSSALTPLSDFNVRGVLAYERAYRGGKFGSLPNISKLSYQEPSDAGEK